MEEISKDLFGDHCEANSFQNKEINAGNLEAFLMDHPLGKEYAKQIVIQKTKKCKITA
jgi:hypothetical protein